MNEKKELLFSLSKEKGDFRIETFRSGGKGGQHQNTTDSGVRIVYDASGCIGESRTEKSQTQNKKIAFKRLTSNPKFLKWLKIESAKQMGKIKDLEKEVDELMNDKYLKVEVQQDEKWIEGKCNDK